MPAVFVNGVETTYCSDLNAFNTIYGRASPGCPATELLTTERADFEDVHGALRVYALIRARSRILRDPWLLFFGWSAVQLWVFELLTTERADFADVHGALRVYPLIRARPRILRDPWLLLLCWSAEQLWVLEPLTTERTDFADCTERSACTHSSVLVRGFCEIRRCCYLVGAPNSYGYWNC